MNLFEALQEFNTEFSRVNHRDYVSPNTPDSIVEMINFSTAANGHTRSFNDLTLKLVNTITTQLHNNRKDKKAVNRELYRAFVRQALTDLHADGTLGLIDTEERQVVKNELKNKVENEVDKRVSKITHHYPAWTLGFERITELSIGPVTIQTKNDWLASIDFPEGIKANYLNAAEANATWKENLVGIWREPHSKDELTPLGSLIYDYIDKCPSVVSVTIDGYERDMSYRLASIIAKTTLDAISLLFNKPDCFTQQTLRSERLPPVSDSRISSRDGEFITLPSLTLGKQIPIISPADANHSLSTNKAYIDAVEKILLSLSDTENGHYPELSNRWATALDWYAEGCRETSDAIAVAKLASSLDVLACVGVAGGILSMTSHLLGISESHVVFKGEQEITLKIAVDRIYTSGRSQILHGSQYDRLKSFAETRKFAESLARHVLANAAVRLMHYTGAHSDTAFRTI
ncbi:hypothetical protein [Pseudomonas coleopterorum]|uniref:hypothetical protein n=1 Tax=Pseudomonas coleopterorum TaxID=1605838 RepID=UPI00177C2F07|nr:hypothetical protein [Pseudomonas coleopterorum]MBD8483473.1 hypothetical protein [Pseudomonas coleopterorum]